MTVGTKSALFGVHQFLYHPVTVALAWRRLYRRWPNWGEWVAIFLHDNYWGLPNIDGPEGRLHPARNARLARFLGGREAEELVRFHSRAFSEAADRNPSALCAPDKASLLLEPEWFYFWRASASGEIEEFRRNAIAEESLSVGASRREWFQFYRQKIQKQFMNVVYLPLREGVWTAVDADAPDFIRLQKWSLNEKTRGRGYAYRTLSGTKSTQHQHLHRLIAGAARGETVDHINGDTLDNRRCNLRVCSTSENSKNLRKWASPTSSQFKGVSKMRPGAWRAYIVIASKQRHLGTFSDEVLAAKAYDAEAKKLFGEFAKLNSPV